MKKLSALIITTLCGVCAQAQTPPVTPAWAFGHIVWEDSINKTEGVEKIVDGYLERNVPVSAVIVDSPWSNSYNDFDWDPQRYADPSGMIAGLKQKGVRTILWLTGNVNDQGKDTRLQQSPMYDYARSKNYGVNNSEPYTWWKGHGIHVDFTNPEATAWWYSQLDKVFEDGVYGWKVDQGEVWLGDGVQTSQGTMSNAAFRPFYYNAMYDYTVQRRPAGIIIARPYSHQGGYAASVEKLSLGWCGDFAGDWAGLKKQIENIYVSSLRGYGAIACEVGGFFMARASAKELVRYAQFGSMTACMINGGENGAFTNHLPWFHGEKVADIYRNCVVLHKELAPYMFSTVVDAHLHGGSLLKNMSMEDESHQLGDYIFTKAITNDGDSATFTLPSDGKWIDFWTGTLLDAATAVSSTYGLDQFPLYIKAGAIIPLDSEEGLSVFGAPANKGSRTIAIWPFGHVQRVVHLPNGEGTEYHDCCVEYDQQRGVLNVQNALDESLSLILHGVDKVSAVKGADAWHYNKERKTLEINVKGHTAHVTVKAAYRY